MNTDEIYYLIEEAYKVNSHLLDEDFINNYLDIRDSTDFDQKWIDAYRYINKNYPSNEDFLLRDKDLREQVFKNVLRLTHSHELAEYVSDDAGLMYANLYFNVNNEFIDYIFNCYKKGLLPN